MILQRYTFGSKSQLKLTLTRSMASCLWYCKDIHLEANHNSCSCQMNPFQVAYDIAKIYIWKQITTYKRFPVVEIRLLMILQRYTFGSKSQLILQLQKWSQSCLWYCKDIHLEANHNNVEYLHKQLKVAYDIAKIYIWKQITTIHRKCTHKISCLWYCKDIHLEANHNSRSKQLKRIELLMILQRYTFGSKSQLWEERHSLAKRCLWYCKDIHLEANHNNLRCCSIVPSVAYDIAKIYIWKQITTYGL